MAEASVTVYQKQFTCAICQDLLKDPVTTACGHNYCMNCIKSCWDQEDHAGVYRCPQCRQTFIPRPVLARNTILAEVVEKLKNTGQQMTATAHYTRPGDVECDSCTGRKRKAAKSCLVCQASYCETHLQPHYGSPAFKKHKLTDATGHLQDKLCSQHDKPLEVYCCIDQQCICNLCTMYEHNGHDTVSADAQRTEIQKKMDEMQKEFQQRIQMRQKDLKVLREAADSIIRSAQSAVEDNGKIFIEMIYSIVRRRSEVIQRIKDEAKAAVSQAKGDMKRLKQEFDELKRRHSELKQLSHTDDHIHFLQSWQSLPVIPEAGFGPRISVYPRCSFENVRKVVSELKDQLENVCEKKTAELHRPVTKDTVLPVLVPRTRAEFLQYSRHLTLEPNTANRHLHLSEGNRVVTWKRETQSYPDHQERFDLIPQVLCTEGLTGRCYWEVKWSGRSIGIAVTYKGISRTGMYDDSWLGSNDKSWCLYCSACSYSFQHNTVQTALPDPPSSRIGVYLDHGAGILSFYSISDTLTLLHRVQTTFTEPLYPGHFLWNSTAKLC
ncbi:tripartite motif-containing protein 16-like [Brienomyrus brachyistius]|uniref:tripartite motif-containing protein 16-like n=1 Tax=Brienomyrus brachyistius TaxID=42636 RepID=UPI0020B2362F|nr:tripartite motif-containing protein 16-like [Brienomyrus brachyistius]